MLRRLTATTALLLLTACGTTAPVKTAKVTPPRVPVIPQHVEPLTASVPAQLQQTDFNDPINQVILQARLRFERGEDLYERGSLKRAKEEFNAAVDLILEKSQANPKDARLQRELSELVTRVTVMELAALREGDGLTDETDHPAAIDDLEHVETFPTLIDPKLRKAAEEEVQEVAHDLPIEINDRVLGFLEYYQNGRGRGAMEIGLERVGRYQPMIERILKEEGVPLDLIYLCQAEALSNLAQYRARQRKVCGSSSRPAVRNMDYAKPGGLTNGPIRKNPLERPRGI